VADLATRYDVEGADGRPTIVFVHGTRLNRVAWTTVIPHLVDAYRCVALDLPGHGAGDLRWSTLEQAGDHVADIARESGGGRKVVLVGLSLGGYVAIEAAARHPDVVSGIVLSGCSADPIGWRGAVFRAYGGLLHRAPSRIIRAIGDGLLRAAYGRDLTVRLRTGGAGIGAPAAVHSLVGRRFSERLRAYDGPVLVVNGSTDLFFRPAARRWAGDRPNTRLVIIRRAGHIANLDRPAAFARLVRDFAERLDGRESRDPGIY
jgi:pimeloyl-ACP methyl ester carboxylesterase